MAPHATPATESGREAPRVPTCREHGDARAPLPPTLPSATMGTAFPHSDSQRHRELPPARQRKKWKPKEPTAPSPCAGHAGDATHAAGDATHLSVWQHRRNKWRQMIQAVPAHLQPWEQPPDPHQADLLRAGSTSRTQCLGNSQCWRNTGTSLPIPFPGLTPRSGSLPRHRCAFSVSTSSSRPSPCLSELLFTPDHPLPAQKVGFNPAWHTCSMRPRGFSGLCSHPSTSGHAPGGAL